MNHKRIKTCKITGSAICRCNNATAQHPSLLNNDHDLKSVFRKLFTDHAVYTKFYIESVLNNAPDISSIGNRLIANQFEIGFNVGEIVGEKKGTKLGLLLKEHIELASATLIAAKNSKDITLPKKKLFENSHKVAKFLSGLNPEDLPFEAVKTHFDQHNTYVLQLVTLHLTEKYDEEVKVYDQYYNHMLMFSDLLAVALTNNNIDEDILNGMSFFALLTVLVVLYYYNLLHQP